MKKIIKVVLLVAIVAVFIWTFVFLYMKSKPLETIYEVVQPEIGSIVKSTIATGKIEPRNEVLIKPQVSGTIAEIYKETGQHVSVDEIIAKIKITPDIARLSTAESRLRVATINLNQYQREYDRMRKLYAESLISHEEYERCQLNLMQAEEEQKNAGNDVYIIKYGVTQGNASLSNTLVRSTINGIILAVPVKIGTSVVMSNNLNTGTTIASVANMDDLIFKGKIDETEVGRISEGMPITLTVGALQNQNFNAHLEYISPKGLEENGANLFEIRANITIPDSIEIRAGYSANADIVLARADNVLTLPESTIEFADESAYVYIETSPVPKQKFERRAVKLGISDGIKIEVKEGITLEDKVRSSEITNK